MSKKTISAYLKYNRERLGLSQEQISEMTGIPLKEYIRYEECKGDLLQCNAFCVKKLCDVMMTDLVSFLEIAHKE